MTKVSTIAETTNFVLTRALGAKNLNSTLKMLFLAKEQGLRKTTNTNFYSTIYKNPALRLKKIN
jgi:tyrosine-protein phosphatase YwqE